MTPAEVAQPGSEPPGGRLLLEEMTWPEVDASLAAGWTTVVVAVGAIEQHGPHLPLLVDAARGDRLAIEVARRLGWALVGPTIRIGCSEHHMAFSGTISLRRSTLEAVVTDYCTSFARHGFRRVCLLPSHGGNFAPLRDMLDDVRAAAGPDCAVDAYTDLAGFLGVWIDAVEEAGGDAERVCGHADIAETSEIMVIRPDLVRLERRAAGYTGGPNEALFETIFRDGFRTVTPNGILGDARGSSAEIGARCLTRTADVIATALGAVV